MEGAMVFCDKDINAKIEYIASRIRVKDAFAMPLAIAEMPTDPSVILLDGEKLRTLSFFYGNEVFKMSHYERFEAFLEKLPFMSGSASKELFLAELSSLYGEQYLDDVKEPQKLWRELCDVMSFENTGFSNNIARAQQFERLDSVRLFSMENKKESYAELVSAELSKTEGGAEFATLDISALDFIRTDDFHAAEEYKKYLAGENDALSGAISGAIYPVCARLKAKRKTLLLNIGENFSSAGRMIKYFLDRDIMPNTVIFARGTAARASAERLCGVYKRAKDEIKIKCGVLYYEGDTVRDIRSRLVDIAAVYPIGEIFVGGALTKDPLVSARHKLLKEGVAEAIYNLCEDEKACLDIAENI